ncbi:hypothetical protein M5X00_26325 [Paenibacillus alvei]|uniref:hypothetical protein n=1 Tax=Paenibacillus alvei TaxID=44250 RepID=UPI000289E5B2|nr:hypothetical protein [Paenibacillus alvei]EJW14079.1 hypothetical protein PAV_141p01850 [Paenibacillus alvei DSM 29]MCY9545149.1 hypothetical protein [Paenibacillus alvei]MCY9707769.1 hypothetical protein [Paenibacillus alvei]MCY9757749.1 hypothetical protein [Paenibacillus alvei]MEC0082718.1 hypothetical protein [Paenibacillus alvei]
MIIGTTKNVLEEGTDRVLLTKGRGYGVKKDGDTITIVHNDIGEPMVVSTNGVSKEFREKFVVYEG